MTFTPSPLYSGERAPEALRRDRFFLDVLDRRPRLQLLDQLPRLLLPALGDDQLAHLLAHFLKRLGRCGFALGDGDEVVAERRGEDGADLADVEAEGDDLELLGQLAALEEARVDVLLALVGVLAGQVFEVFAGLEALTQIPQLVVRLVPL